MTEAERGDDATHSSLRVGDRLRAIREEQGIALSEIAARTRVPLRHLEAIEASDYAGLPSATYAVGFVKAYARTMGADEVTLARDVRAEVARTVRPTPHYQPYEIADPARLPSRGVAIVAAGLAISVLVLAILWFASGMFGTGRAVPDAAPTMASAPAPVAPVPPAPVAPPTGGQVTLAATGEVWLRVYDAANKTLYFGTMKAGDRFDVPADADNPMINVGRPDLLAVTLNGSAVPPLGTAERAIKDVPVSGAAIAARLAGGAAADAPPASPTRSSDAASAPGRPSARSLVRPSRDSETRRANLNSPTP